jgi:phage terminase large subunit
VQIKTTSIYEQNAIAFNTKGIRRALNEGGTWASKTYSILQLLILINQYTKTPLLTSIVSESLPHLRRGCLRDFFNILGESQDNNPRFNKSDHVYDFGLGKIEFFGADEADKLRGGRRDILFVNEANNISWNAWRELDTRTRLFSFLDWNPVSSFWAHEYLIGKPENVYIHSTFLDAMNVIPTDIVTNIKRQGENDPNWWNVYGLGRIGKVEGLVYPYFEQVDELPKGNEFYGLDFGYSNDPTALTRNIILDGALYSQELIYEAGLTNDAIAHRMDELGVRRGYSEIFADSAEPKSIEEIHRFGFNIKPCTKGADSVEYGHQKLRQYKQFWTKGSLNGVKEQRNFRYIQDKDGKFTDKTTHNYSHLMDSRRYAVVGKEVPSGFAFDFV